MQQSQTKSLWIQNCDAYPVVPVCSVSCTNATHGNQFDSQALNLFIKIVYPYRSDGLLTGCVKIAAKIIDRFACFLPSSFRRLFCQLCRLRCLTTLDENCCQYHRAIRLFPTQLFSTSFLPAVQIALRHHFGRKLLPRT